jgi:hypothetical protein
MPAQIWIVSDLTVIGPRPPRRTPRSARTHSLEADRCRPTSAAPDGRAKASPRRRLVQNFTSRFRGKCRTCVIDGVLEHSPAEHVAVPPSLPSHPPSGSANCSSRPCSPPPGNHRTRATSRWWPCSDCSACGSSKPPARTSPTSARSTVIGCCACAARAPRSSWSRCRQRSGGPSTGQPGTALVGRSCSTAAVSGWTVTPSTHGPRRVCEPCLDSWCYGSSGSMTGLRACW